MALEEAWHWALRAKTLAYLLFILFHVCVVQDVSPRLPCPTLVTAITPNVMNPDPSGIISSNKLLLL